MRGARRGRARRAPVSTTRAQVNRLKSELHGHSNRLRHLAPPGFSRRPFNNLVVSHVIGSPGIEEFFNAGDVITFLKNQLGLQDQTKSLIVIKLHRIDYYAVPVGTSTDRPSVSMSVSSLIPTVGDPATPQNAIVSYGNLFDKQDLGSLQDCAKLSYTFPKAMSDIPLSQQASFNFLSCAANVPNSEIRFHLQWSTIAEATPTDE